MSHPGSLLNPLCAYWLQPLAWQCSAHGELTCPSQHASIGGRRASLAQQLPEGSGVFEDGGECRARALIPVRLYIQKLIEAGADIEGPHRPLRSALGIDVCADGHSWRAGLSREPARVDSPALNDKRWWLHSRSHTHPLPLPLPLPRGRQGAWGHLLCCCFCARRRNYPSPHDYLF